MTNAGEPATDSWDRGFVPPGLRIYCIGDVHGRSDLLKRCRTHIETDLARRPVGHSMTIMLGDYIDRGPDSRGVLDILTSEPFPNDLVALRGNHEQILLDFLEDPAVLNHWRLCGGLEALHSFGVPMQEVARGRGYLEARDRLLDLMPDAHLRFIQETAASGEIGGYFFCHAGVMPGVELHEQREEDLLWIRQPFLDHSLPFGKIVIHGHTATERPELRANRIGIDTGAYATGRLTCLVLEGEEAGFLLPRQDRASA
ncbi:MAG: metallophosphoesterase family protein [Beijerinckiaceae bacterium]|nr:metallophosphoesterase family protein [Beijerinckiaceae bacterium]